MPAPRKYQQLEVEIRKFVENLPLGTKLPAERDLAEKHQCNFLTVRRALKQLVDDGTIVRRVGSGTFIARPHVTSTPSLTTNEGAIGMLVYQGSNAYAYRVLQSLAQASISLNLDLRSSWVSDFGDETLAQVEVLKRDGCCAITLPWFPHEMVNDVRKFVMRSPLPVSLPLIIPGLEKNCFEHEDVFGAAFITDDVLNYFRLMGRDRIAIIGPHSVNDFILQKKITGYIHYVSRENLPSLCGLVAPGAQAMDQLAERWKQYAGDLAVVCYDDEHALRFMTAMHKLGLNAPDDYVIIGYNDTEGSRYSDPPLTTIHQDFDYVGHWLLKNAEALSEGGSSQATTIPRLTMLVRQSCGGRDKITDELRAKLEWTDLAIDNAVPEVPKASVTEFEMNGFGQPGPLSS